MYDDMRKYLNHKEISFGGMAFQLVQRAFPTYKHTPNSGICYVTVYTRQMLSIVGASLS